MEGRRKLRFIVVQKKLQKLEETGDTGLAGSKVLRHDLTEIKLKMGVRVHVCQDLVNSWS